MRPGDSIAPTTPVPQQARRRHDAAVQRLGDEGPQAFETPFHRYYEALYNFAHFYVRSRAFRALRQALEDFQ